jgi:fructuronate reductase
MGPRLSRDAGQGRGASPVRAIHLGLGNFVRAHPCLYTERAPDAARWGIAAFTGPASQPLVDQLTEQQGLYTLVSRGRDADSFEVIISLSRAHAAADNDAWLRYFEAPELAAVTITVTEAGYCWAYCLAAFTALSRRG